MGRRKLAGLRYVWENGGDKKDNEIQNVENVVKMIRKLGLYLGISHTNCM